MKVLLINPPGTEFLSSGTQQPALGFLYLAGEMRQAGHDVKFVDGCIFGRKAVVEALEEQPDVVGIQCLSPRRHKAFDMVYLAKQLSPQSRVVMGGPHPTALKQQILEHYPVDAVCAGEGEKWLRTYVETDQDIPAVYENLDDLPEPAWDLIRFEHYMMHVKKHLGLKAHVSFSRSCPWHCSFCAVPRSWGKYRTRSAENMIEELKYLYYKRGVRYLYFVDDILTAERERSLELFEAIVKSGMKFNWDCATRIDCVDQELLDWMRRSGCFKISYGFESGSPKIIKNIYKGMAKGRILSPEEYVELAVEACQWTKDAGIKVSALMMIGNPGETDETISDSYRFLKRIMPDHLGAFGGVWIIPNTALYTYAKREGHIDDNFWLERTEMRFWPFPFYKLRWWKFRLSSYKLSHLIKHIVASYLIPRHTIGKYKRRLVFIVTRQAHREISFHNEKI